MSIPNYREQVAAAASRYPDAWRHAHTGDASTEEFIRLLARDLHAIDPRCGLNGKRGNPNDISDDVIAIRGEGSAVDVVNGGPMEIIDVIVGAGGPNPQPGWAVAPGGAGDRGAWVKPEASAPTPQPQPSPQPVPVPTIPPEYLERLDLILSGINFLINQIATTRNDTLQIHNQLSTVIQRQDELTLRVLDVRKTLDNGLEVKLTADLRGWGSAKGPITGTARG
jgi:hypothetical protein